MRNVVGGLLLLSFLGCGGEASLRKPLFGKVTLEAATVENATIKFFPIGETKGPTAFAAIEKGEYRFTSETGPYIGLHRVEIDLNHQTPAQANQATANIKDFKQLKPAESVTSAKQKMQWEFEYLVPSSGDMRKDFDLKP